MKIFLVDDDPSLRSFVERWLTSLDRHELWIFDEAASAIDALPEQSPCLVLSDLDMPGLSGEELAQAAARLPRPPRVVLMSGDHDRLERARGLAEATLQKPFSFGELLSLIETRDTDRAC